MQLTKKIAFSVVLLFLATVYGQSAHKPTIDSQQPTASLPKGWDELGMTIFDSNTIFVENNSLVVQNGFTTVLNNANRLILSTVTAPPRSNSKSDLNQTKQRLNKPFVVAKTHKVKNKTTPQFIAWGNLPYGNNSLYNVAKNFLAVLPTLKNYKLQIKNYELRIFNNSTFDLRILNYHYKKQLFHSHQTIIISYHYSKTSRIRPPPSFSC